RRQAPKRLWRVTGRKGSQCFDSPDLAASAHGEGIVQTPNWPFLGILSAWQLSGMLIGKLQGRAVKTVVGMLSARLQVRVLLGSPSGLFGNGSLPG
ncbi:MAG: hypothetical protein AAF418_04790, partial [Pseudomonadota bacterium]